MNVIRPLWLVVLLSLLCGCGKSTSMPATPEGTVEKVTSDLADDKPEVVWHALPAKYQTDVKDVIVAFADKMDAEVWNQTFAVLNKAAQVTKNKKEFILGMAKSQGGGPLDEEKLEQVDEHWDRIVEIFEVLVNSEIKTVEGLKTLDPASFLSTTGSKLSKNFKDLAAAAGDDETAEKIESLDDVKATVVKSEGDKATIKVQHGETSETFEMVKVDGRWLPAEMVSNWDTGIAQMKQAISTMDFSGPSKQMFLTMLGQVDGALDQMLAADSQEEFSQAAGGLMPLMMGFGPHGPGLSGPGEAGPNIDFSTLPTETSIPPTQADAPAKDDE